MNERDAREGHGNAPWLVVLTPRAAQDYSERLTAPADELDDGFGLWHDDMPLVWTLACGCELIGSRGTMSRVYIDPDALACEQHGRQPITASHDMDGNPVDWRSPDL